MNIEILPPKRERQIFRPTHHFQKHSPRRARPSHEMRVGNSFRQELTSPKIFTKGQNQTLPATATPSLFHAIRYVDDDGRVEENTLDNTTTDDEEDHTDVQKNQENVSQPHTLQTSTISPTANATTPTASRRKTRLSTATSTSTGKRKAAATSSATSPSPVRHHATNQMTKWSRGSTTVCEQVTRQTICWQQMESRRGSSDSACCVGNKQEWLPSATKDARQHSSPTGNQRYQPSRKGIGSKEDQQRDGKTTPTHTYNQPESSETTAISRTKRFGSPRRKMARVGLHGKPCL